MKRHMTCFRTRHNHHVNIFPEKGPVSSINLPQVPFDSVALDRVPYFARYRTAELPSLTFPPKPIPNESTALLSEPFLKHSLKFVPSNQTFVPWKRIATRQTRFQPPRYTVKRLRPFARRRFNTSRPPTVAIRVKKP